MAMTGNETDETFFSRWSRRKARVRQETAPPVPPVVEAEQPAPAEAASVLAMAPVTTARTAQTSDMAQAAERPEAEHPPAGRSVPPPTLEEVTSLTPASDFSRFVAPGVDSGVKNAAMKKLFTDPHFNVMDGLDTYIEDYGRADPIPKSMLRQMVQARMLGLLDDEMEEQPVPAGVVTQAELVPKGGVDPTPSAPSAPEAVNPLESASEALQIEIADDAAMQQPSTPPEERTASVPEPPAA
jgi:hypothetical protein